MTQAIVIFRERFSRLIDGVLAIVPKPAADGLLEGAETVEVDDDAVAHLRQFANSIPIERVERITDATLSFTAALAKAGIRLVSDLGPEDAEIMWGFVQYGLHALLRGLDLHPPAPRTNPERPN